MSLSSVSQCSNFQESAGVGGSIAVPSGGNTSPDPSVDQANVGGDHRQGVLFDNSTGGEFISLNDAAKKFGVSVKTVRRMVATGKLKSYRLPGKGRMRLKVTEVDDALVRIPDPTARKV